MKKYIHKASVAVAVAALCANAAYADQLSDIKAKGELTCGVLEIFEPFGFTDTKTRKVAGYDVDVCEAIAKKLGVKPVVKPVADAARIPELQQGRIDILAAGLAYTQARATQVNYSDVYYVSQNVLVTRSDRGVKATPDLAGKRISYVKGTISQPYIEAALPTARPIGYDDVSTAFTALVQGKVDAFSTSEEAIQKLVNRLGSGASNYAVVLPALGKEEWSIGVRKNEDALLNEVNKSLRELEASGDMQRIFDSWLGMQSTYKMTRSFKVTPMK